jgi:hypothetical protein
MRRRDVLKAGVAAGAVFTAGCTAGSDDPAFEEGFENGTGEWTPDAAIGPEVNIEEFEWEVTVSGEQAAERAGWEGWVLKMGVQLAARWVGTHGVVERCLEQWEVPLEGTVVLGRACFEHFESGSERRRHQ